MGSKKIAIIASFVLTIGLAVAALFIGIELNKETNVTPDTSKAQTPLNCDMDKTHDNILNDLNMGFKNDGPYLIPEYCPGHTGKFKVSTTGKLFVYLSKPNLFVKINEQSFSTDNGYIETDLLVNSGDYVFVWATVIPSVEAGIGWINPIGDLCGREEWGIPVSVQSLIDQVAVNKQTVIEKQCWGDTAKGTSDFDFDDFQIILAVEPLTETATPTSIPSPSVTMPILDLFTPVTSLTPSPTVDVEAANRPKECGASNTCINDDNCTLGNVCQDVNNVKRCVASICVTDGVVNEVCESDLCTAKQKIEIQKTVSISCVSGQNKKMLSYFIVLTNPIGNMNERSNISVIDTLDARMQSSFIIRTSIPFKGTYENNKITWNGLTVTPNGGRLEIRYNAIIPPSEYGQEYTNSVVVSENGVVRGGQTIKTKIEILPCTALFSDEVDRILIGIVFVIFGLIMYAIGVDKRLGSLLWKKFGREITYKMKGDYRGILFRRDKEDYETNIIKAKKHSQRSQ